MLIPHAVAIDVDIDILEKLLDLKMASVLCLAVADYPGNGRQLPSKLVLFLDCILWLCEDVGDIRPRPSACMEVGLHKVGGVERIGPEVCEDFCPF